jgi:hypothetical protein
MKRNAGKRKGVRVLQSSDTMPNYYLDVKGQRKATTLQIADATNDILIMGSEARCGSFA